MTCTTPSDPQPSSADSTREGATSSCPGVGSARGGKVEPERRSKGRRVLGLAVLAVVALLMTGCYPDNGIWGPETSTYNNQVRVEGSGFFYNDGGTHAASGMIVRDRADDGNSVYGKTTFEYLVYDHICGCMMFKHRSVDGTPEISNTTEGFTLRKALRGDSMRSRGTMKVCAQMGWPVPDSCSVDAFAGFEY